MCCGVGRSMRGEVDGMAGGVPVLVWFEACVLASLAGNGCA